MEGEAFEAMCAEKENINSVSREMEKPRALFNEPELMGGDSKGASVMIGKEATFMDGKEERQPKKQSEVGLVEKMDLKYIRADERVDGLDKELGSQIDPALEGGAESNSISSDSKAELKIENLEGIKDKKVEPKRSWANVVDDNVNSGQNKNLTESERRKRDRALKRRNWSKQLLEESELSGKSLSYLDISNRVSNLVKDAKRVLNLGKKIGCHFVGDENEIINDLVELELKEEK
ncbi:hypothetical protein V6N13_001638 [Hibiscus sabdariffa]